MIKLYAKYMKYGKIVRCHWTHDVLKLIEDMDAKKEKVKVVSLDNYRRYELLGAWIENWNSDSKFRERFKGNIEECAVEREGYVEELKIAEISPANKIRFITPHYETKFEVEDLSRVRVNGKVQKVYYIDDYHFGFVDGNVYHICEYAELCEKNGIEVKPLEPNGTLWMLGLR